MERLDACPPARALVAGVAVALMAALVAAAPAGAAFPGRNGRIAFGTGSYSEDESGPDYTAIALIDSITRWDTGGGAFFPASA